jgi:phage tail sheath gpL-like
MPQKIYSSEDAALYAGQGSILHLASAAALKANAYLDLTIVPIPDAAGTDATGTIAFSDSSSTTTGTLDCWIGNRQVQVSVATGDTTATMATNLAAAIVDIQHELPVTATAAVGTVTLVARNKGTQGNAIPVSYKKTNITGPTITVVQPTAGTTDPALTTALTNIEPAQYDNIVSCLNDSANLLLLKTHLQTVSGSLEDRPGLGYFANSFTAKATVETLCGTTLNYERLTCAYLQNTKTTERGHSLEYEIAAAYAAVVAAQEDPAMPFYGATLPGIAPVDISDLLTRTEQESCLQNGVTPCENGPGSTVQLVRTITTYITNSTGIADVSMLDLPTMRTLDYTKLAIETRQALRFARAKLSSKTPAKVRSQIIDVLKQLELLEILENVEANLDGIIVEKDSIDANRLNCLIPADVVNGLAVLANRIDLIL